MKKSILWYHLLLAISIPFSWSQALEKHHPRSYYYLKDNGGYEYAFNTDTGMQSSQRADQANEVTGHYMYYEKGVPFMVKYRAGVNGFQPEIIPAEKLMGLADFSQGKLSTFGSQDNVLNSRGIRTNSVVDTPVHRNYRLTQTQQIASPKVASYSIGQIQHPAGPFATTTPRAPTAPVHLQAPVSRNDVQDINNLAASLVPQNLEAEPKQPYSFTYNADQSSRSESADQSGTVVGSYSYYDEAGYHDVSYKASDDTGFVILGRNSQSQMPSPTPTRRQYYRPNSLDSFNYRILSDGRFDPNSLDERNLGKRSLPSTTNSATNERSSTGKRSLRKFRRYSKW
ncbi:uncharacterized protein LOC142234436 [Haematobia irritans]|uniref:uncharacterized protein LOC142234436 n=1 Tax=Haematobia irritans TaxID=7368 RepID=UPI003F503385